jgi:hypothetical protein
MKWDMLWFIRNRKVEYEDEKVPMPVIWTVIIALVVVAGLVIGAFKFSETVDRYEMRQQYGDQYEEVL